MKKINFLIAILTIVLCSSCSSKSSNATETQNNADLVQNEQKIEKHYNFNQDSAYAFIEKQCSFGPRVPNTNAHLLCGDYLVSTLKRFGAEVTEQKTNLTAYDGSILKARNIIAQFNKETINRIILFAHWDTRPFCDQDKNSQNKRKPVMGANDGASGVGVLLEIARQISINKPNIGVDIVFFDAEDYGEPSFFDGTHKADTWCLGSQYWGKNTHYTIKPKYGILLDMVGGFNPEFCIDMVSYQMAPNIVQKVWACADNLGYNETFLMKQGGEITDDHLYVNLLTGIPTIDIIDFNTSRGFPETWHTVNDIIDNIDRKSLMIVGNVVTTLIYTEK